MSIEFECGHTAELPAMPTFFRRCPACQAAWRATREQEIAAAGIAGPRDALDTIFAYDSSDDARMPPPPTAADEARIAALHAEAQERVAAQRAWAEQEAWENGDDIF